MVHVHGCNFIGLIDTGAIASVPYDAFHLRPGANCIPFDMPKLRAINGGTMCYMNFLKVYDVASHWALYGLRQARLVTHFSMPSALFMQHSVRQTSLSV